jgi:hypothetical protein
MGVHVLAHLRRVSRLARDDLGRRRPLAGAGTRLALVAGTVAAGSSPRITTTN